MEENIRFNQNRQAVLAAIKKHYKLYAIPPTLRWISEQTHIKSTSQISSIYLDLEKLGYIIMSTHEPYDPKPVPIEIYKQLTGNRTVV